MPTLARLYSPDGKWELLVSTSLDAVDGWEFSGYKPAGIIPGYRIALWREAKR